MSEAVSEPDLAALQGWMLAACTAAGGVSEGLRSGERDALEVSAVVRGSRRLSPEDRLAIYAKGYLARLLGCLRAEFPALRALAGDQVFDLFAQAYIWARPPASYSLFDLGAGFPGFLEETRPRPVESAGSPDAVPAALARLERARLEARHAPGVETDLAHRPIDPVSVMTTPDLAVRAPESLRLLRLDFALVETLAVADRGDRPAVPPPGETYYAVARSRYRVRVHVLAAWEHAFLQACGTGGVSLQTAAGFAAQACELGSDEVWAGLLTWLPLAVDAGMATVRQGH